MTRIVLLGSLLACLGCYSNNAAVKAKLMERGDPNHPLYVGTTDRGEIVIAATHYDAMSGLAIAAPEIGKAVADGLMTCRREMLTGTHVPSWICRYNKDIEAERQATADWIDKPRNCQGARCMSTSR